MTYYASPAEAEEKCPREYVGRCSYCGEQISGPLVWYDLLGTEQVGHFFHLTCASTMAQGMICDTFPNREEKGWRT